MCAAKIVGGVSACRFKARWRLTLSVVVTLTSCAYLLQKNRSLNKQVEDLQEKILKLNLKLWACDLLDVVDNIDYKKHEDDRLPTINLKVSALIMSLTMLFTPFLILFYIGYVSKLRRSSENISEEVSLNKKLAYQVDVFLSVLPYAKPLSLLIATLLLICLGGMALFAFGGTDDSLPDCLWLSWTYVVADSGNHANSIGILVSVSISFGGMLIFAMMLGLVSEAISEKVYSLRKGRSEVVEQNHSCSWME